MKNQEKETEQILTELAHNCSGKQVTFCTPLPASGSNRRYYRLTLDDGTTLIGAYNEDVAENEAFFSYTDSFVNHGLHAPHLLCVHPDRQHYLQQDLGTSTLYDYLCAHRDEQGNPSPETVAYYEQAVRQLPRWQMSGRQGLDFSVAYPRPAFDRQSMQWDLNYFKYYFLKLLHVPFNEQKLEEDYNTLIQYLLSTEGDYFLFRDFQSRNIMIDQDQVYFIDYQGGRKGALQYDIASLLYDAKADLPASLRIHLLEVYMETLSQYVCFDREQFLSFFQSFALIRILQSMGTYGYRGYFERKSHFLQSIPYAARNLTELLDHFSGPSLPELTKALRSCLESPAVKPYCPSDTLTVLVQSFSYKKAIPADPSPNGGGFVFDCRALPNPGREKRFALNTGRDECVAQYLQNCPEVHEFRKHVFAIVDQSVDNYLQRHFTHLSVCFGCTGGQHRSVYFAEQLAQHLRQKYAGIKVIIKHTVS